MVLTPYTEMKSMATTKTNLTDHQRCVLRAASLSANLNAWPLPRKLNLSAGSAAIVVSGLLKKGLSRSDLPAVTMQSGERMKMGSA
jgi:hypothetical protein